MTPKDKPFPTGVRGLQREMAARYVGVGATKFDELVDDGRMPKPKRIDGRKVWDRMALDSAFEALPSDEEVNPWDVALEQPPVKTSIRSCRPRPTDGLRWA